MRLRTGILIVTVILGLLACEAACYRSSSSAKRANSNVGSFSNDSSITLHIQNEIADRGLSDVSVTTSGGQVLLSGYADDDSQRLAAEVIARETPGVVGVTNNIVVCKRPPVNLNKPGGPRKC